MGRANVDNHPSGTAGAMSTDPFARPTSRIYAASELPVIVRDAAVVAPRKKIWTWRFGAKWMIFLFVFTFLIWPLVPQFRGAASTLGNVQPALLVTGVALQVGAWSAYSMLTGAALGEARKTISFIRLFRIQMSSKALTLAVPGGNAAGAALGYRLLTLSGIRGADAGFAMATAGIGSAVVLNMLFLTALLVSIPTLGLHGIYALGVIVVVVVMLIVAGLVLGLLHGQGQAERAIGWIATRLRFNPTKATRVLRQIGKRLEELIADRALLKRVVGWSLLAWLLDATSLWVFLRAYGFAVRPDALLVSFGLANVLAAVPISPGGLGLVDAAYNTTLIGLGMPKETVGLGVASYRLAQWFFPIMVGAFLYLTLRVGPWSISRKDRLKRLTELVREAEGSSGSQVDFLMRTWPRRLATTMPTDVETSADAEATRQADAIVALDRSLE